MIQATPRSNTLGNVLLKDVFTKLCVCNEIIKNTSSANVLTNSQPVAVLDGSQHEK